MVRDFGSFSSRVCVHVGILPPILSRDCGSFSFRVWVHVALSPPILSRDIVPLRTRRACCLRVSFNALAELQWVFVIGIAPTFSGKS